VKKYPKRKKKSLNRRVALLHPLWTHCNRRLRVWPGLPPLAVASDCPLPMAPAASTPATFTAVYVAAVPLRAPKGPAQLLMSAGYSLGLWDLQHFMVLLRPDPARTQVRPPTSPTSIAPPVQCRRIRHGYGLVCCRR
jgi:hypothetical protein